MYEWRASLNRRIAMQGQQAKMVRPTQERVILGYLATTRALARDRVLCLFSMKAGLRAKAMASRTWAMVTDATGQGRGRSAPWTHAHQPKTSVMALSPAVRVDRC